MALGGGSLWIPWSLRSPEAWPCAFFFLHHQPEGHPYFQNVPQPPESSPSPAAPGTELGGLGKALAVLREALVGPQLGEGPMEVTPGAWLSPGRVGSVGLASLKAQAWGHVLEPDAPVTL